MSDMSWICSGGNPDDLWTAAESHAAQGRTVDTARAVLAAEAAVSDLTKEDAQQWQEAGDDAAGHAGSER